MSREERKKKIGRGAFTGRKYNKNYILDWKLEARNIGSQTTNHNEPAERLRQRIEKR